MRAEDRRPLQSGPFGRGGNRPVTCRLEFRGRLGAAFAEFALLRARRLDLTGTLEAGETVAVAIVSGPEALVGAFETACCIGPDGAQVEDWSCQAEAPGPGRNDFATIPARPAPGEDPA